MNKLNINLTISIDDFLYPACLDDYSEQGLKKIAQEKVEFMTEALAKEIGVNVNYQINEIKKKTN